MGNDGKQSYRTMFYNLDAILSVGYRVNSRNATLFRRWATQVLKTYLLKGYAVNTRLAQLEDRVDRRLAGHDDRISTLESKVDFFVQTQTPPLQGVFYGGQLWDARAQYPKLAVRYSETFHDRFLIIDDRELYLIGASLKDLGKKCFAFTKLDAGEILRIKKSAFASVVP